MPRTINVAPWLADQLAALQIDPEFVAEDLVLDVCEQLSVAMAEEGVSQKELAARLGKSPSAVSQLLSGDQNISLLRLVEVALALNRGVAPPRLIALDPPRIVQAEETHYSYLLDFSCEADRSVDAWLTATGSSATGGATAELHAAIRHAAVAEAAEPVPIEPGLTPANTVLA
ncbi:MAG: helix-turn-helix transcriptional regulator [Bacteroidota bacterium]